METISNLPLWTPLDVEKTSTAQFIQWVNRKRGLQLQTYLELQEWSTGPATYLDFWDDAYDFLQIGRQQSTRQHKKEDSLIAQRPLFPPLEFFPSTKLNICEVIFRNRSSNSMAIHFAREDLRTGIENTTITWGQLKKDVQRARDAMISSGIQQNDVVAAVTANSPTAIVLCLAAASIGAIWSSTSSDLGAQGIIERYTQTKPKIIFADNAYVYSGKLYELGKSICHWSFALANGYSFLEKVVVLPYVQEVKIDMGSVKNGISWEDFLKSGTGRPLAFTEIPFSHPAFILYSSGTTGKPKCIVHSAGGALLKAKVDSVLQHDIRRTDVVFQYTTTSWVMWLLNFLNLANASSMLLFDGSPFYPTPDILLKLADDVEVTVFGTSPRYLTELKARGIVPRRAFGLKSLRTLTSTGAVLSADMYRWFYNEAFPQSVHLISMCGGTDIAGCFLGGSPLLPVYAGELQARCLGMAIDIFDSDKSEPCSVMSSGQPGELVCTQPFPSQPLTFYGADGGQIYRTSYFERFGDSVWCQNDFIQLCTETGGLVVLGRSDGVLNPSGVRFGSAEIYAVTEKYSDIDDAICVGQRRKHDTDERVLLFLKMKPGRSLTEELIHQLKTDIKTTYSRRHVPSGLFEVSDIPYTVNGKKCEINVKQIVSGMKTAVSGTVANPQSLDLYTQYLQLGKTDLDDTSRLRPRL